MGLYTYISIYLSLSWHQSANFLSAQMAFISSWKTGRIPIAESNKYDWQWVNSLFTPHFFLRSSSVRFSMPFNGQLNIHKSVGLLFSILCRQITSRAKSITNTDIHHTWLAKRWERETLWVTVQGDMWEQLLLWEIYNRSKSRWVSFLPHLFLTGP